MAIDLFFILAISSEYEREFSSTNNIITNNQNRLADEMIKTLEL